MSFSLTSLVENVIIDDLLLEPDLAKYTILSHDAIVRKDLTTATDVHFVPEHYVWIVVTAFDHGDFVGTFGAGIRKIDVEVSCAVSMSEGDNEGSNFSVTLDAITNLVAQRLQPSSTLANVTNREWSTSELKVFGVLDQNLRDARNDLDKDGTRERIVERTFVAAQLA